MMERQQFVPALREFRTAAGANSACERHFDFFCREPDVLREHRAEHLLQCHDVRAGTDYM